MTRKTENFSRESRHPLRKTRQSPIDAPQKTRRRAAPKPPTLEEARKTPLPVLNGAERTRLRGEAHSLKPVVLIGENGVSEGVIQAVHEALCQHELIKVRMHDPENKQAAAELLAAEAHAVLLGLRGHTVILYRPFLKV